MEKLTLKFTGSDARDGQVDLYDLSRALQGLHRSLGITTNFALTGEIATQSPSINSVRISAGAAAEGSWEIPIYLALTASTIYKFGTAPRDTVIGHLAFSLYDIAVKSIIGTHVDFDKSLTQLHAEVLNSKSKNDERPVDENRLGSLIEKIEPSVIDMHRPIAFSESANKLRLLRGADLIIPQLDYGTYENSVEGHTSDNYSSYEGRVSSYNMNTYKGRIFLLKESRSIPFLLDKSIRTKRTSQIIANSLARNITNPIDPLAVIKLTAFPTFSLTNRLKSLNSFLVSA